ncbi:hypothetical protein RUM43_011383 [Polyplax serrata]|uniref:Uncharacterized protein n=1 Tax=Polyplax serrata TaxID=468196 RepID=A0AAN8S112_POLSC
MAAKEKKSTVAKHLKDTCGDKEKQLETPKGKRGRKPNASNDNKLSPETKTPVGRKKRRVNEPDGGSTPSTKRARRSIVEQEEPGIAKTPPPTGQKMKKAHLEKELGDLLENATGRNTPLLPRNKKINEREEETVDSNDEKNGLYLTKGKKNNEKDADDDNMSVKSFSTLLRTRKNVDKEVDDDVMSVKSVTVKSKRIDANEDDTSGRSLLRPNLINKPGRKKKSVLTAIAVKKKIFIRRGRPKKIAEVTDGKGRVDEKRGGKIKVVDKGVTDTKQKRIIKKPLKFQNKIKDQTRLRSSIAIKNQKLKKTKLKLSERLKQKGEADVSREVEVNSTGKERQRTDSEGLMLAKSDISTALLEADPVDVSKKKFGIRKRKMRSDGRNEDVDLEDGEKGSDVYYFSDLEVTKAQDSPARGRPPKILKHTQQKGKLIVKKGQDGKKKKKRDSGIHFETTRSPDDSSVIIVHPRLGPKIKGAKRLKSILPKADEVAGKRTKNAMAQDLVPPNMLPNSLSAAVSNFNQLSGSYLIPNFNLFANNSTLLRSYNPKSSVSPNLDASTDLTYGEEPELSVSYGPKLSPNELVVTSNNVVLSASRIVSPGSQHSSSVCINGSNSNCTSETSNGDIAHSPNSKDSLNSLTYQKNGTSVQPNSSTTLFLKRPESMSTSLISTTTGAVLINSNGNSSGGLRVTNVKSHSVCNTSTDTIASEKALEGDFQASGETSTPNRFKNISKLDTIPSIPVAKSVNDLLILKNKANLDSKYFDNEEKQWLRSSSMTSLLKKTTVEVPNILKEPQSIGSGDKLKTAKSERKYRKRPLKNVRHFVGSGTELTFSEPESSSCENEDTQLYKTISCERVNRSARILETSPKVLLQLGSEPIVMSDSLAPYETASMLLVTKKEKIEEKLDIDGLEMLESPRIKEAVDVCKFSKENEEALREFGLDSDLEMTKSEVDGDSPIKGNRVDDDELRYDENKVKRTTVKDDMNNILKEMPIRKISNLCRKGDAFNVSSNRLDVKSMLVLKNNDYLSVSPSSKPPTVIDKLLERNKSLKKAEQEGKYENVVRNLSENSVNFEGIDNKQKKSTRELRARKFVKGMEPRRSTHKKYVHGSSGCKIYERRGSNPEMYSNNYLTVKNQVANENVPLRRVTDPGDGKYQRRGSIDYEAIQKVFDRRCSLPTASADADDPKHSKSLDDVNKLKTENVKTIVVGTSKPLTSKNRGSDVQPRVINIVTSNCGLKKGKNLMEEIGLDIASEEKGSFLNGDKSRRRVSVESSNSDTESLQKLLDGLSQVNTAGKLTSKVPYYEEKSSLRREKIRLSIGRKSLEDKEKKNILIEESPEDLVTKETILSALGLQSLKAAAESAQRKKENQNQNSVYQTENGGYTGTLKTVIKIQRQEKKGSSKSPTKMVYKASSSSSSVCGQFEDSNHFDESEGISREDAEEAVSEDNKNGNGKAKSLVIPEKASSFSIHPGRMCSDVCTYCFGKFGLLDTPCHIAQLKDADKRRNILATEVHLTADSCLCDACFRHVDKKSNCPTFTHKKGDIRRRSVRKQTCIAQNCNAESQHSIRRKIFVKLKKSIGRKVILDGAKLEKLQPGQTLTFCNRHIYWIDYFMSCGICKKRLKSVNMYRVSSEVGELNSALSSDEIPAILTENRFLCKICNCFASIRLKYKNPNELTASHRQFYETCRKRILKCHGIDVPDSEVEGETKSEGGKSLRRTKRTTKPTATVTNENSKSDNDILDDGSEKSEKELRKISHMNIPPKANGNLDFGGVSITPSTTEVNPTQIHVKLGNLNIGALGNLNIGQDVRHGSRSGDIQCFPTETELALRAHFDLKPSAEDESAKTARKGFEKCTTTIQFSPETKNLFYNLQMPYGNQSSFFRHLILLEKYFRSGDLVISKNADPKAINYISSVQNRIRSYEGVHNPSKKPQEIPPSLSILPQPIKMETRNSQDVKPSVMPSRPFTLTPMPSNSSYYLKNSPLSQIQATVQNIQPVQKSSQGIMTSLLKSSIHPSSKYANHPKPEVSITSVTTEVTQPVRVGSGKATVLTSKIQENLRNLASKSQMKQASPPKAVILNRTIEGQKQSLVQVTTGGKTIHLTLPQFRKIQQIQMRKKQYLEHQAKMLKGKDVTIKATKSSAGRPSSIVEESFNLKNLSPELEIEEVKQQTSNGTEIFPLISEVRSLAGEEANWDRKSDSNEGSSCESFPKIPKTLSVSVTKIPASDCSAKEQSVE